MCDMGKALRSPSFTKVTSTIIGLGKKLLRPEAAGGVGAGGGDGLAADGEDGDQDRKGAG